MKTALPELYSATGLVNMKEVSRVTGIGIDLFAKSVDITPTGLRKNPTTKRAQLFGRRFVRLFQELVRLMAGDTKDAMIWLRTERQEIENKSPLDLLLAGDFEPVEYLVYKRMAMGAPE